MCVSPRLRTWPSPDPWGLSPEACFDVRLPPSACQESRVNRRMKVLMLLVAVMLAWYAQATWTFTTEQATAGRAAYEQQVLDLPRRQPAPAPRGAARRTGVHREVGKPCRQRADRVYAVDDAAHQSRRAARGDLREPSPRICCRSTAGARTGAR